MVRNAAAFAPFGTGKIGTKLTLCLVHMSDHAVPGHHSCLGRFLALDTMRYMIARLVKKYRFRLPAGETGSRVMGETKDQFTTNPGPLSLNFELR